MPIGVSISHLGSIFAENRQVLKVVQPTVGGSLGLYMGTNSGGGATSSWNTAIGSFSMLNTTGDFNTSIGFSGLSALTTGTENTAAGAGALFGLTTGDFNSAFGKDALEFATTETGNSAFGHDAMGEAGPKGDNNAAFGRRALLWNQTDENSGLGAYALEFNTNGTRNVAVGYRSLSTNVGADDNVSIGHNALATSNPTTGRNTAIGSDALGAETTGNANTAVGYSALFQATGGTSNVAVGAAAGSALTSGSNNIYLDANGASSESNKIRIGRSIHSEAFVRGIFGNTATGGATVLVNSSGELHTVVSSARFKVDVRDMAESSRVLMDLRPVTFRYRAENTDAAIGTEFGLIAEEVAAVAPEMVLRDDDGKPFSVRYHLLSPMLLNEVQRQQRVIDSQAKTIADLVDRIERLESGAARSSSDGGEPR